jgi:hypothetical protein
MDFVEEHPWISVALVLALVLGVTWGVFAWIGQCHTQHRTLRYHEAYSTCTVYQMIGSVLTCTVYTQHPARCSWDTTCDVRCKGFVGGLHSTHETYEAPDIIEGRCQNDQASLSD